MEIIRVENLSFKYKSESVLALKNLSFSVEEGEFLAIIGHNGSGKSTLAKTLNALIIPEEGEVFVCGNSTKDKEKLFEIRKNVGVVFQNPDNQLVASIVEDDVAFGPENIGLKREEIKKRIDFALDAVGMTEFKDKTPTHLSGGQKQRIAIAGVLAVKPKVLVLDESTAMLDPKGRKEVMEVVKKLNKEGITVIHITHYMDEVTEADRVLVMSGGEIKLSGTPEEIFAQKQLLIDLELDVPEAKKIADELIKAGFNVPKNTFTKEALLEALCKLKLKI